MSEMKSHISTQLINAIERFKPFHDGKDRIWRFFLKSGRSWIALHITLYNEVYYFNGSGRVSCEIGPSQEVRPEIETHLATWLAALDSYYQEVSRDPLAAQQRVLRNMPLTHRFGLILRSNVRRLLPGWRDYAAGLQDVSLPELESLLERRPPEPLPDMTLARYLEYCRIGYEANPETFFYSKFVSGQSGLEFYRRYADGRHGGLLDIEPESPEAFAAWYHSGQHQGCHPWEIYRGGNSTHISLAVTVNQYGPGWRVILAAFSSTRMVEACRIALALDRASLPIEIIDRESYLLRLRDEDWVGILPEDCGLGYGWHNFPSDYKVADSIHLSWFLEDKSPKNERSYGAGCAIWCSGCRCGFHGNLPELLNTEAPGRIKRKMPEPIPVMVLGRLAVDLEWQKKGIGQGLLKDAVLRTLSVAKQAGIRALIVLRKLETSISAMDSRYHP